MDQTTTQVAVKPSSSVVAIALPKEIVSITIGDVEITDRQKMVGALQDVGLKICLKAMGVTQLGSTKIKLNTLLFNETGMAKCKLPKQGRGLDGQLNELPRDYYDRCKPYISQYFADLAFQGAFGTFKDLTEDKA